MLSPVLSVLQVLCVSPPKGTSCFSDYCEARRTAQAHAEASAFSLAPATFYDLFPYHLVLDNQCRVLQVRG